MLIAQPHARVAVILRQRHTDELALGGGHVLADEIVFASDELAKEWDVNGKNVKIAVAKL